MTRAVVTGAAGFLGRHLVASLLAEGTPTVALCRRRDDLVDLAHPSLTVEVGDVRDAGLCGRLVAGADVVHHLAAVRNQPGGRSAEMVAVNEVATLRLARQATESGVRRFVNVSSAHAFGPSAVPLDESAPLRVDEALGAYGRSRARAMLGLRDLAASGAPVVTLCPTIIYGPDHPSHPNRVTTHLRRFLRAPIEVMLGAGTSRRDLVHVDDVTRAALDAARAPAAVGQELILAGEPISQRDLGTLAARCAGRSRPRVVSLPIGPARGAAFLIDSFLGYDRRCGWATAVDILSNDWCFRADKARAVLGYRPRPLAEGIAETIRWMRGGGHDER